MDLLRINLENIKISPLLSHLDDEILIDFIIESNYIHDLVLKIKIEVKN